MSSGFYVLCCIGDFAETSSLPARKYRSGSVFEFTEEIMKHCAAKMVQSILAITRWKGGSGVGTDDEVTGK